MAWNTKLKPVTLGIALFALGACGDRPMSEAARAETCAYPASYWGDLREAISHQDRYGIAVNNAYICAMTTANMLAARSEDADQVATMAMQSCNAEVEAALAAEVYRLNNPPPANRILNEDEARSGMYGLIWRTAKYRADLSRRYECWKLTREPSELEADL